MTETPTPKKENFFQKIFRKKTPEEKAEKEEAKREKKIAKADAKYQKAIEKAERRLAQDPNNPENVLRCAEALEKAEAKHDKKLGKLGVIRSEVEEIENPAPTAAVDPTLTTTAEPTPTAAQTPRTPRAGVSSAYDFGDNTDDQTQAPTAEPQQEGAQQGRKQPESLEDLLIAILQSWLKMIADARKRAEEEENARLAAAYDQLGKQVERMSFYQDQFDARVDQRAAETALQNGQDLTQTATLGQEQEPPALTEDFMEEQPAPATPVVEVDRTPLTTTEQKNFDSWMATARISEEDKNKLIEKYGPKDAYDIAQKCMAEPTNVMVTAGQEPAKSKPAIEYFANLDVSKPENRAIADNVIAMDPPKFNTNLMMQKMQRA